MNILRAFVNLAIAGWRLAMLRLRYALWKRFGCAVLFLLAALAAAPTHAGDCRIYSDGSRAVESCDNGSVETWGPRGRHRQYGERNGGFDRYPGEPERPILPQRDEP